MSPGRVPKPPECPADEAGPAGAAQADRLRPPRDRSPDLRPRIPLAPSIRRHRLTPLDEQGASRIIRRIWRAGITFFRRSYPRGYERRTASAARGFPSAALAFARAPLRLCRTAPCLATKTPEPSQPGLSFEVSVASWSGQRRVMSCPHQTWARFASPAVQARAASRSQPASGIPPSGALARRAPCRS